MTNEAGLEFEMDEETTTINTVKTGDYDVVPSVFHYREKEMPQKLGCAADYDDTCFPCHAKGIWCERAEEMKKKMPPPMTIEMEADARQAALNEMRMVEEMGEKADFKMHACVAVNHWHIFKRALQSPRVPVIEALDSIIQEGRTWYGVAGNIDPVAVPMKDFDILMRCARAYAELQKGGLR